MNWRPQRGFRVGAMRERVDVQSLTISVSDAGDRSESWADTFSCEPASIDPVSGGETLRGRQVEAGINVIFTVRYRSEYVPEMRVAYNSTNYGIVYVRPVEGGRRYIELFCKAVQ